MVVSLPGQTGRYTPMTPVYVDETRNETAFASALL